MSDLPRDSDFYQFDGFRIYYSAVAPLVWSEADTEQIVCLVPLHRTSLDLVVGVGEKRVHASFSAPQIAIIPIGEPYSFHLPGDRVLMLFWITPDLILRSNQEILLDPKWTIEGQYGLEDPVIQFTAGKLREQLRETTGAITLYRKTWGRLLAVHLFIHYARARLKSKKAESGSMNARLTPVISYISDNLDRELKVASLAHMAELSQPHFCRLFKKSTGLSPYRYILLQRIARAKELLDNSRMSLSDIALQCGFYDQSHFNLQFRSFTGMTPKAYRDNS